MKTPKDGPTPTFEVTDPSKALKEAQRLAGRVLSSGKLKTPPPQRRSKRAKKSG